MKRLNNFLLMLLLLTVAVACNDDYDTPPLIEPKASHTANMTIAEFKAKYWQDGRNYCDTIKDEVYIHGWVASDDEAGNVYKYLYIEDENGDGIGISIDQGSLNTYYRRGQEIVLSMKDFWIGKYNGQLLIGQPEWYAAQSVWEAGRLTLAKFQEHAEINGLPDPTKVVPTVTKISDFNGKSDKDTQVRYQGRLITVENVTWDDADGKAPYAEDRADGRATERKISDADGNQLIVNNSMYADFHQTPLPVGEGSVTGILYLTGDDKWMLLLRDLNDVVGFGGKGAFTDPYTVPEAIEIQGSGKKGWMTGYVVGAVAPEVTTVSSNSDIEWTAPTTLGTTLVIAETPDVKDFSKCILVALPQGSSFRTLANLVDNPEVLGTQIFVKGEFANYMGMNGITGNSGTYDEYRLTIATGGLTTLDEQFEGGFPSGWLNIQAAGDKAWYLSMFGTNTYAAMTGYRGNPPFDSWMITPALAINKAENKTLTFETQVNGYNSTTSRLEVYVMTTSDPATAQLTKLDVNLATAPASGYSDWVKSGDIDLSAFDGTYYIGFRYYATADANYATWCVDNVQFNLPVVIPTQDDFETMNQGEARSTFGDFTSANGWKATNCSLLKGGTLDSNPVFQFIGFKTGSTSQYAYAPCLNGNTSSKGSLLSPGINNGITHLTFSYAMPYSDAAIKLSVVIFFNNQPIATYPVEVSSPEKFKVYSFDSDIDEFVGSGVYTIGIFNEAPSNLASNKDRVAVWNVNWTLRGTSRAPLKAKYRRR